MALLFLQFLPILIFVVVDSVIENTVISIVSAVACTAVQAGITLYVTGEFDYFLLGDLALIAVMGGVSIAAGDARFFLLKPAIIEALCIPFLLFFVFAPDAFIVKYFGRYMPTGRTLTGAAIPALKLSLAVMSVYVALHALAVVYASRNASRKMWAFISGPGFYFVFIPVMACVLFGRYRQSRARVRPPRGPEPPRHAKPGEF